MIGHALYWEILVWIRYTAENSVKYGALRNTEHPELRQPTAQEVIENILYQADEKEGVIFVTGGPLSNIAKFISSNSSLRALVKVNIITSCTCITNKY